MDRADFLKRAGVAAVAAITPPGLVALNPEAAEAASKGEHIVRVGKQHLGTPYHEMNCSDFTRRTYGRAVDVWMPADWRVQDEYGHVPQGKRRGDLLCFRGHVGIYAGNDEILHSSSYFGEVCISSLTYLVRDIGRYRVRRIR